MMQPRKALGRGLDALISPESIQKDKEKRESLQAVPIDKIFGNREQPRESFGEETLQQLALSIKEDGVLQPIVVSPLMDGRYELIAGERRLRASKMAGLEEIPVVLRKVSEEKRLELALVENIQRENLNPIEEAKGYQKLSDQFQLSFADIGEKMGKSREHIANTVRLLKLPKLIREDVMTGKLNAGQGRSLLALPTVEEQIQFRNLIVEQGLSVRDIERMIQEKGGKVRKNHQGRKKNLSPQVKLLLDEMEKALGTKVRLHQSAIDGRGTVFVEYFSWQDLDRIYKRITKP